MHDYTYIHIYVHPYMHTSDRIVCMFVCMYVGAVNFFGLATSPLNYPAPGKRPLSSMSPSFVLSRDGRLRLVGMFIFIYTYIHTYILSTS